jgi:hypothetical protein
MKAPRSIPYTGIDSITAWEIDPRAGDIHVILSDGPASDAPLPPGTTLQDVEARWNELCRANPRLYDGPILSVTNFDPERNIISAYRSSFKRLAVKPNVITGVRLLAVTAMLTSRDAMGREHILLGQRGTSTRIFGGLWEVGPSGGVPVPPPTTTHLTFKDLRQGLLDEIKEELGEAAAHIVSGASTHPASNDPNDPNAPNTPGVAVAYIRDHTAHSDDLVIRCTLPPLEAVAHLASVSNWEYSSALWVPVDTLNQWDTDKTIDATRAALRVLGYIDVT